MVSAEEQEAQIDTQVINDDTNIYFYSDITSSSALALIRKLNEVDSILVAERTVRKDGGKSPIQLHINSGGGNVLDALAIVDHMQCLVSPVHTYAEGVVASAATMIYIASEKRYAYPSTFFLMHPVEMWFTGTHLQLDDLVEFKNKLLDRVVKIYVRHTFMSEGAIKDRFKRDSWLDVDEAVALGMVDMVRVGS